MEKLKIGKIVGTHALKGELKIRSFSDFNDQRFVVGHKLYLNEIVDPFIIKTVRVHKGNYLISFEGLQDINLVEKYIGYNVYGLKEDVELDDDEYFYDDLIGCQIINNDQEIGKVESVYFNGAHDVLTVQTANKKIAIPYVDAFIENEDIENKKIFVHLLRECMMKIDILSLFPEMFEGFLNTSIIKRAIDKEVVDIKIHNFREFTQDKHKHVDDYPYGGGQGMVLMCQPIIDCLKTLTTDDSLVILMSPQGITLKHQVAQKLSLEKHLIIICGHYEGFDERIRDYVDLELSIGDYVLTGGELGSMVTCDAVIRLLEGAIRQESHEDDSFADGLLEYPQYTRPIEYDGNRVPDVLVSGHHENIRKWRKYQSLKKTYLKRPDLLENYEFDEESANMLNKN